MPKWFIFILLLFMPASVFAESSSLKFPSISIPEKLQVYADISKVTHISKEVLDALSTAKFSLQKGTFQEGCQDEQILSIFRGQALSHAGYSMFINRAEQGWVSAEMVINADGQSTRAFLQSNRLILLTAWNSKSLHKLLALRDNLPKLPENIRSDLRNFLIFLRDTGKVYQQLKKRGKDEYRKIIYLASSDYFYKRIFAKSLLKKNDALKMELFKNKWPEYLDSFKEAESYRELANQVKDFKQKPLQACLDDSFIILDKVKRPSVVYIQSISFGDSSKIVYDPSYYLPNKYAVSFWHRRDNEGTTALAAFVLDHVIQSLE
ncbi:MAG: hypothetical protein ACRBBN_18715 [Methyloligellaceae bacterium]